MSLSFVAFRIWDSVNPATVSSSKLSLVVLFDGLLTSNEIQAYHKGAASWSTYSADDPPLLPFYKARDQYSCVGKCQKCVVLLFWSRNVCSSYWWALFFSLDLWFFLAQGYSLTDFSSLHFHWSQHLFVLPGNQHCLDSVHSSDSILYYFLSWLLHLISSLIWTQPSNGSQKRVSKHKLYIESRAKLTTLR